MGNMYSLERYVFLYVSFLRKTEVNGFDSKKRFEFKTSQIDPCDPNAPILFVRTGQKYHHLQKLSTQSVIHLKKNMDMDSRRTTRGVWYWSFAVRTF